MEDRFQKEIKIVGVSNSIYSLPKTLTHMRKMSMLTAQVQKKITTGQRVSDAVDDGAAFAVAQSVRGKLKGIEAVSERLSSAKGFLQVTLSALTETSNLISDAKSLVVKLADPSLSAEERVRYRTDYLNLKTQIRTSMINASFNGRNILRNTAAVNIIFNEEGGSMTVTGQGYTNARINTGMRNMTSVNQARTDIAANGRLSVFENEVLGSLATVSGYLRRVDAQEKFLSRKNDALVLGLGSIVDADLSKESALLESFKIRE